MALPRFPAPPEGQDDDLLLFAPVALDRVRRNGWTAERQRAFVAMLARTGVVRVAAAAVGMSARSAYQLARRGGFDHPFVMAWDAAMERAKARADVALAHGALEPELRPIVRRGRIVGSRSGRSAARPRRALSGRRPSPRRGRARHAAAHRTRHAPRGGAVRAPGGGRPGGSGACGPGAFDPRNLPGRGPARCGVGMAFWRARVVLLMRPTSHPRNLAARRWRKVRS